MKKRSSLYILLRLYENVYNYIERNPDLRGVGFQLVFWLISKAATEASAS